jgi:hypothetical protein
MHCDAMYVNKINLALNASPSAPGARPSSGAASMPAEVTCIFQAAKIANVAAPEDGRAPTTQNLACRDGRFVGHIELLPERDRKLQTIPI